MKTINVHHYPDIFERSSRVSRELPAGGKVASYLPEGWEPGQNVRVNVSGMVYVLDEVAERIVGSAETLSFYRMPADPSGGFLTSLLVSLLVSAVITGVSYAVQALTAPSRRSSERDFDDSPTYGFDGFTNTTQPGTRAPLIYGQHRFGGHILQQFLRPQRDLPDEAADPRLGELNTLLGMGLGPIQGITGFLVDGNSWSDFGIPFPEIRVGLKHQAPIDGFQDTITQNTKDVIVTALGGPQTFTMGSAGDSFEIIFRFPGGLYRVASGGGFGQSTCKVLVQHRLLGSSTWIDTAVKTVTARTANSFDAWFSSGRLPRGRYEIRVIRLTPDEDRANGFSELRVLAVLDVVSRTQTWPGLALMAPRQLPTNRVQGRSPEYSAVVNGRIVRVFSDESSYIEEWSDSPAWVLLDFLTAEEACGNFIKDDDVDRPALLYWGQRCVDEGFKVNIVVDGTVPAIDIIKAICTAGRANFVQKGRKWSVVFMEKKKPVQGLFMGRIRKGQFAVLKRSRVETANYITAQFWNAEKNWERDTLPREDPTLGAEDDIVPGQVNLVGVTDPKQVQKLLNYYMLSGRLERRVIELECGVENLGCEAGDVFEVAHDVPGWGKSGRVSAVNEDGSMITVDRDLLIEAGKEYELTVLQDDERIDVVRVTNAIAETTRLLSVSGDFTTIPRAGLDYAFGEVGKSTVLYTCKRISRGSAPHLRKVTAQQYDERVFDQDLTVLPLPSESNLPDPRRIPGDVKELRLVERQVYSQTGSLSVGIDVFFTMPVEPGARARIYWREEGQLGWELAGETTSGSFTISDGIRSPDVTYDVSVVSVSQFGISKGTKYGVRATITMRGITRQPGMVLGFRVARSSTGLVFEWDPLDPVQNFDLDYYEIRQGTQWETAVLVGKTRDVRFETGIFITGEVQFLIKGVNTAKNSSATAAASTILIDGRIGENVVKTQDERALSWPGTRLHFSVDSGDLVMDTQADVAAWRVGPQPPRGGGLRSGGFGSAFRSTAEYISLPFEVTTGNAVRAYVSTIIDLLQIDVTQYWTAPGVGDKAWDSDFARTRAWAAAPAGRVNVRVEMRFSITGSNDGDFGPWAQRPQNLEAIVKWAQARIVVQILDPVYTVRLKKLTFIFDVPDVTDSGSLSTSAVGTVAVSFSKAYENPPEVVPSIVSGLEGDSILLTSITNTGFLVGVKLAGDFVARTVKWISNGF